MTTQVLARDAEEDAPVPIRRFGKMLAATLLRRFARMLPVDWRILLWRKKTDETIIASLGSLQIRQIPGGCHAQTCVKGDITLARGTALLRLAKYVSGDNRRAASLDAELPLLQQLKAPGLWQVAVRLTALDDVQTAPVPRAGKVKIVAEQPTTWAVVTLRGRPTEHAIERAQTVIMDAIARSRLFVTGSATIRIHAPASLLPFMGSFEVAVPVFCHPQGQSMVDCIGPHGAGRAPTSRPANLRSPQVH